MIRTSLLALALLAAPLHAFAAPEAGLTIHLSNVRDTAGTVMIAIYADEAGWRSGTPARMAMVAAAKGELRIEGLAPGRYAIKLFNDADGDHQMGKNPFGMPTEQYGFSNDAIGNRGPAAWADAAFEVTAAGAVQTITLR